MSGFSKLALVETKLFLREKVATLAVFGLPVALVIGFGLIPGFGQPQTSLSEQIGTEYIAAIGVASVPRPERGADGHSPVPGARHPAPSGRHAGAPADPARRQAGGVGGVGDPVGGARHRGGTDRLPRA